MSNKNQSPIQKGPIAWMSGNSVAANLLMLLFLVGGCFGLWRITKEVNPQFEMDMVEIIVSYPGASPEEVENGIILAIEEVLEDVEGIKEVTAVAAEGSGTVYAEAMDGFDASQLAQDIKNEIDAITTFPTDSEKPIVAKVVRQRDVITFVIYGDISMWNLRQLGESVRNDLLADPRITQVSLSGIRDYEIAVELSQENLRRYNLTLDEVAKRISAANTELPGGGLKTSGGEILVRVSERKDWADEFAKIPIISNNDGTEVLLEDIASIKDDFADTDFYRTYNGMPAITINVFRVGSQTPASVAAAAEEVLEALDEHLPAGVHITVLRNASKMFNDRMELLGRNAYTGLILVFIMLALFLEPRLAFWVTMGIPVSFLGAFLIIPGWDNTSLNMNSMFAFIIALGIVVDDAIVVGENIFRRRALGESPLRASINGAREVAMPVTFSIITNVVTFLPLYFITGMAGRMFNVIPIVVITVILISLVESFFILPAHLADSGGRNSYKLIRMLEGAQKKFSDGFSAFIKKYYPRLIHLVLTYRYISISLGLAILMISLAFFQSGRFGMTLFERIEADFGMATLVLPYGAPIERTEALANMLEEKALEVAAANGGDQLFKGLSTFYSNSSEVEVRAYLQDSGIRPIETGEFVTLWRDAVGEIPGAESLSFSADAAGPGSSPTLELELSHPDSEILNTAADDLARSLAHFSVTRDIDNGVRLGKPQLNFKMTSEGLAMGLDASTVAQQVRAAFQGLKAVTQQRGRNEVVVRVRLPQAERNDAYTIENLIIRNTQGQEAPLMQVAETGYDRAYTTIDRRAGKRVISVTAYVTPETEADRVKAVLNSQIIPELLDRYPGLSFSYEGRDAEMNTSLHELYIGLLLALMVVYALLAVAFRSFLQPLIVMSCIPFGIVGAAFGHWLLGYSLSIMSIFGIVALTGVVLNDSLVFIDLANRKRREGMNVVESLTYSGVHRFRAIFLTSTTTFGALFPIIFETSRQARFLIPMAISLGFGVLFAMFITLLLIPAFYLVAEDLKWAFGWKERKHEQIDYE